MTAKQTKLDVLFPNRDIELSDGSQVTVSPLSLEDLPKVIRVLAKILKDTTDLKNSQDGKVNYIDIVAAAGEEVMKLFPYCLSRDPKDISALDAPDIIEIILEQNLTEASLGKWVALIQKLAVKLGVDLEGLVDQGKQALKKN